MYNFFRNQKGITALELLLVIAVLLVIFSVALPQFSQFKENQIVKSATGDILSSINKARSKTLASVDSSEYGVRFESDRVIIFKGKVFSAGAIDNETIYILSPAIISNVTLGGVSGGSGDMYFNRLSGVPSVFGTITLSSASVSKVITISATGIASMN